jgi:hypothetical protein
MNYDYAVDMTSSEIRQVSISKIRVSGLNEELYHPVSVDDPATEELARSIEQNGILEPLVLSEDFYIISGHRRYAASKMAGLPVLPCYIRRGVKKNSDEFLKLVREYNRHRVKTIDEHIKEAIVDSSATGKDSRINLTVDHYRRGYIDDAAMEIIGKKTRARISKAKFPFLDAIIRVLNETQDFWPLSDRQIHYRLLNNPPLIHARKEDSTYTNDRASYQALCDLLTRARLDGDISWEAIADPTRPVTLWHVYPSVEPFINKQLNGFLKGYWRDYTRSQPHHIEIVGEKSTVLGIIKPIAMEYCIPVTIGRGYSSLQPRYELSRRYEDSGKEKLVLLILSDHDPDGEEIAQSFCRSMRDDFGIWNIHPVRVALTRTQVDELGLPPIMQAKKSSSNYKKFVKKHGDEVFELEAVPPETLQEILRDAILSVMDIDALNRERKQEQMDRHEIQIEHDRIMKAFRRRETSPGSPAGNKP